MEGYGKHICYFTKDFSYFSELFQDDEIINNIVSFKSINTHVCSD